MSDELREKIAQILRDEMITIGVSVEDTKTGQMWTFDAGRLSSKILTLIKQAGYRHHLSGYWGEELENGIRTT